MAISKKIYRYYLDGNDEGIFGIERDENNKGVITLTKRLDREKSGMHVLTIKCFKPSNNDVRNQRKQYDKMVRPIIFY